MLLRQRSVIFGFQGTRGAMLSFHQAHTEGHTMTLAMHSIGAIIVAAVLFIIKGKKQPESNTMRNHPGCRSAAHHGSEDMCVFGVRRRAIRD